jgi:sensor c-di-GMP phosphodiesterase-like protein
VASEADLLGWGRSWITILSSIVVLAALFAWVCAIDVVSWLNRYWSFEARFCRYLSAQSVVIAYQPVLDLKSGKVSGCEVLARWRDIDGTIVAPNRFIDIVERKGCTLAFTRMVADNAHEELSGRLPADLPLQINFNVFARDFESETLLRVFSKFAGRDSHLTVAVELVENDEIDFEKAQLAIEELGRAGIKTYIDDFGTGYSSIERVARLAVHGVKLDRSFAMSPPDSVLGRMLVQVIDMIKTSGHLIVVEGVETEARLNLLRSTGVVDYVQGYVLSRPLGIDELVAFLSTHGTTGSAKQLAA